MNNPLVVMLLIVILGAVLAWGAEVVLGIPARTALLVITFLLAAYACRRG